MAKLAVSRRGERSQLARRKGVAGKERDDAGGEFGVWQTGKAGQIAGDLRQPLGHIKPAILRQPGKQRVGKR